MKILKLEIVINKVSPKPPLTSILGQNGININKFIKEIKSLNIKNLYKNRIKILVKKKSFKILVLPPTINVIVKDILKNKKINKKDIENIYKIKKNDFNTSNKKKCFNMILGTLKSMKND
ncbi:hypothetical protein ACT2CR_00010 [Candidatus Vidania fulgoroideorum]